MCVTSLTSVDLALKWALFYLHRIEVFATILKVTERERKRETRQQKLGQMQHDLDFF